jgi:SAM-dependent methyltransferase
MLLDPDRIDDASFDALYPPAVRAISSRFWTPVDVARRAARWFRRAGAQHVLDVGSGVGKFALVAAATEADLTVLGVEQRPRLVEVARDVQIAMQLQNAAFEVGDVTRMRWRGFDGLYFFNPLGENLHALHDRIDDDVELTEARFFGDVLRVERSLRAAPLGTVVVTYHGMSGRVPACYDLARSERAGTDWLRLWVKQRDIDDGFFLETGDGAVVRHRACGALT